GHDGVSYRSLNVFSATGERRGGPSCLAGQPSGTTPRGRTWSGSARSDRSSSPKTVVIVVRAEPSPSACAASNKFCTAGQTDDSSTAWTHRDVSPQTTTRTGAFAIPPVAPASTFANT